MIAITQLIKTCYKVIEHIIFHKNIHCTTNLKRDYTQMTSFEFLPSETRKILTCKLYGFTLSNHFILKPGSQSYATISSTFYHYKANRCFS